MAAACKVRKTLSIYRQTGASAQRVRFDDWSYILMNRFLTGLKMR